MHALTVLVDAASVDAVSDRLGDDLGAFCVSVEDADAGTASEEPIFDDPGELPGPGWRRARLTALFAAQADAIAAAAGLIGDPCELGVRVETIAAVEDCDWVHRSQAQFGPIEIDEGFWIVPSWSAAPVAARTVVRLDPGVAFGTGTHPTTRMCLRWIVRAAGTRVSPWSRVLDYGSGSGILAIAAALVGAASVDAVDIDPAAVAATRANARANGVEVRSGAPADAAGDYQLIVANILSTPLKLLAPLLARRLGHGGDLLLSGILVRQAEEVRAAYAPWLEIAIVDADDGWVLMAGHRREQGCVA